MYSDSFVCTVEYHPAFVLHLELKFSEGLLVYIALPLTQKSMGRFLDVCVKYG